MQPLLKPSSTHGVRVPPGKVAVLELMILFPGAFASLRGADLFMQVLG